MIYPLALPEIGEFGEITEMTELIQRIYVFLLRLI